MFRRTTRKQLDGLVILLPEIGGESSYEYPLLYKLILQKTLNIGRNKYTPCNVEK